MAPVDREKNFDWPPDQLVDTTQFEFKEGETNEEIYIAVTFTPRNIVKTQFEDNS